MKEKTLEALFSTLTAMQETIAQQDDRAKVILLSFWAVIFISSVLGFIYYKKVSNPINRAIDLLVKPVTDVSNHIAAINERTHHLVRDHDEMKKSFESIKQILSTR